MGRPQPMFCDCVVGVLQVDNIAVSLDDQAMGKSFHISMAGFLFS
jgi:hypothetical protein